MDGLLRDLRYWPGVAAVSLHAFGFALLGIMALESRGSTCFITTCGDSHLPSPAFLLAIIAIGNALIAGVIAIGVAVVAAFRLRKRYTPTDALTLSSGVGAFGAQWLSAALLGHGGATFPIEFATGVALIGSYAAVTTGAAPLGIGWGAYRMIRHRSQKNGR